MSKADRVSAVVVSYIPGLYAAQAGEVLEPSEIGSLANIEPHNQADACIWGKDETGFFPVFLFDDAPALCEHLLWWCDGHPDKWFKLAMKFEDDKYALSLLPDLERSASRWKYARKERFKDDEPIEFDKFIYSALSFMSAECSVTEHIDEIMAQEKFKVGFVETSIVDTTKPQELDDNTIRFISDIARDDSEIGERHMEHSLSIVDKTEAE